MKAARPVSAEPMTSCLPSARAELACSAQRNLAGSRVTVRLRLGLKGIRTELTNETGRVATEVANC